MNLLSPGLLFKEALQIEKPLQIVGVINAYVALLAKQQGFRAIYLSGAGIANASYGLPDLSLTSFSEVAEEIRRITNVVDLPLLVDADTGFGSVLNVARTVKSFEKAGACGLHIEDQLWPKRCGHLPHKQLASKEEMCDRIKAAVDAREDQYFVIMARTDAFFESREAAIERANAYVSAGADMIFAEAMSHIKDYETFAKQVSVPILANITEFGKTPLLTRDELKEAGVAMALYPLSAFRAMNYAAEKVFQTLRNTGTQKSLLEEMQTREELYQILDYDHYEEQLLKRS